MRMPSYLTLALLPAALVAQAPALPDYMGVLKAETPGIEDQLKSFRSLEALAKAEALLPPALPAFDKSTPTAAMKTSISFSGLTRLYLLAAKAAVQAGDWEKVKDLCIKAEACAKVNADNTKEALTPLVGTWTEAVDKAKAQVADNADRIKAIQAKTPRTPQEEKEYKDFLAKDEAFRNAKDPKEKNKYLTELKAGLAHFKELEAKALTPQEEQELAANKVAVDNLERGPKTIKVLQENIDAAKAEYEVCGPKIEATDKNLKAEAAEFAKGIETFKVKGKVIKETSGPKFEEKKAAYFESVLTTKGNYESRPAKLDRMNFLFRLRHNVLGTPLQAKVDDVIARVRNDQEPFPAEKKAAKGKKAK